MSFSLPCFDCQNNVRVPGSFHSDDLYRSLSDQKWSEILCYEESAIRTDRLDQVLDREHCSFIICLLTAVVSFNE